MLVTLPVCFKSVFFSFLSKSDDFGLFMQVKHLITKTYRLDIFKSNNQLITVSY